MTPRDVARLEFEHHADLLARCLGRGGATVDMDRARLELQETELALRTLAVVIVAEMLEAT